MKQVIPLTYRNTLPGGGNEQICLMTRPLHLVAGCIAVLMMNAAYAQAASSPQHSDRLSQSMSKGVEEMQQMKPTCDVDKDFAMMMKIHHQQAVDMAQVELKHGKSSKLKRMAKKIVDGQRGEIKEFDKWLRSAP